MRCDTCIHWEKATPTTDGRRSCKVAVEAFTGEAAKEYLFGGVSTIEASPWSLCAAYEGADGQRQQEGRGLFYLLVMKG